MAVMRFLAIWSATLLTCEAPFIVDIELANETYWKVPSETAKPTSQRLLMRSQDDGLLGLHGATRVFHGCLGNRSLKSESVQLRSIRGVLETNESSTLPSGMAPNAGVA